MSVTIGDTLYPVGNIEVHSSAGFDFPVTGVIPSGTALVVRGVKEAGTDGHRWVQVTASTSFPQTSGWAPINSLTPNRTQMTHTTSATSYGNTPALPNFVGGQYVHRDGSPVRVGETTSGGAWVWSGRGWTPGSGAKVTTSQHSASAGTGYYVQNGHAYLRSTNKDLGILVGSAGARQTVKPTNGGRLWALYNLGANGTLSYVGSYGSVPGAPPPPNAAQNNVPAQFAPPPPPIQTYGIAPGTTDPSGQFYWDGSQWVQNTPTYSAPPVYAPAPMYAQPTPVYAQPTSVYAQPASVYAAPGVPAYDPTQAALYAGAAYGAQAAAQQQAQYGYDQQGMGGMDALTMSIMMGGGVPDYYGTYSGMAGGLDPMTLAYLSGGDSDYALQMALMNGGYDPTAGFLTAPMNPLPM